MQPPSLSHLFFRVSFRLVDRRRTTPSAHRSFAYSMLLLLKTALLALTNPLKILEGCRNTVLFPFRSFGIAIKVFCAYFYLIFFSFKLTGILEQLPDVFMALVFVFGAHSNQFLYLVMPTVQTIRNVKLGLVGMCLCVWATILSIFLHQNEYLVVGRILVSSPISCFQTSRCLYHGLFLLFAGCFFCFENSHSLAIVQLPDDKRPFSEVKPHLIVLGALHLIAEALMLIVFVS